MIGRKKFCGYLACVTKNAIKQKGKKPFREQIFSY